MSGLVLLPVPGADSVESPLVHAVVIRIQWTGVTHHKYCRSVTVSSGMYFQCSVSMHALPLFPRSGVMWLPGQTFIVIHEDAGACGVVVGGVEVVGAWGDGVVEEDHVVEVLVGDLVAVVVTLVPMVFGIVAVVVGLVLGVVGLVAVLVQFCAAQATLARLVWVEEVQSSYPPYLRWLL
jgi:hypothetical protein